ncbi:hypothetical protein V493_04204 [Pseudogymnoascus sp. VKM F-4281 (FW-2241)]|nr:hypothetical protein V493_04204 [Pseudogymnoascus sp. VKM F-4281 (FW-2241)]
MEKTRTTETFLEVPPSWVSHRKEGTLCHPHSRKEHHQRARLQDPVKLRERHRINEARFREKSREKHLARFQEVEEEAQDIEEFEEEIIAPIKGHEGSPELDEKRETQNFITDNKKKKKGVVPVPHKKFPRRKELELMFPAVDPLSILEEEWKSVREVLMIGRDVVTAPPKPKDRDGERILTEKRAAQLCPGIHPAHESLPYTVNAKGAVYQRLRKEFEAARDIYTGKFTVRNPAVPPVMDTFSAAQALAAALVDERGESRLKAITGREIGLARIPAQRKKLMEDQGQAITERAQAMRAQKLTAALVQRETKRQINRAVADKDEEIARLQDQLRRVTRATQLEHKEEVHGGDDEAAESKNDASINLKREVR